MISALLQAESFDPPLKLEGKPFDGLGKSWLGVSFFLAGIAGECGSKSGLFYGGHYNPSLRLWVWGLTWLMGTGLIWLIGKLIFQAFREVTATQTGLVIRPSLGKETVIPWAEVVSIQRGGILPLAPILVYSVIKTTSGRINLFGIARPPEQILAATLLSEPPKAAARLTELGPAGQPSLRKQKQRAFVIGFVLLVASLVLFYFLDFQNRLASASGALTFFWFILLLAIAAKEAPPAYAPRVYDGSTGTESEPLEFEYQYPSRQERQAILRHLNQPLEPSQNDLYLIDRSRESWLQRNVYTANFRGAVVLVISAFAIFALFGMFSIILGGVATWFSIWLAVQTEPTHYPVLFQLQVGRARTCLISEPYSKEVSPGHEAAQPKGPALKYGRRLPMSARFALAIGRPFNLPPSG